VIKVYRKWILQEKPSFMTEPDKISQEDEVDAVTGEPRSTESARSSSSEPRVEAIWDRLTHGTLWGVLQD
jgi:hypothetical protein